MKVGFRVPSGDLVGLDELRRWNGSWTVWPWWFVTGGIHP
jgi:hypothetical protein